MREDMFKVIVERPRRGWRTVRHNRTRLAGEDDLPVQIGMRRHLAVTRQKTKWLNENLNPLERYLAKQVGRPWNKVYSEISATLAPGHTVKEHVRQHLDDFVVRKVAVGRDGQWVDGTHRRFGRRGPPWYQAFYVDPNDGILKESAKLWTKLGVDARPWRSPKTEANPDVRALDTDRELRRIDGVWYEVTYRRDYDCPPDHTVFDLVERVRVPARHRHAASKHQLARAELIAHALANDST
jgi:hypothetical protein